MRLIAACWLITCQTAAAQTKLEWKFTPGETFAIERVLEQMQEVTVKGRSYKQQTSTTWLTRFQVKEKVRGDWVLLLTIDDVTHKAAGVAGPLAFDDKLATRLKGMSLTLVLTPRGEITKLTDYEDFIKKLAEEKKDVETVLRALFSEESLQETFQEMFAFLPKKPVKEGDPWKRTAIDPLPPFGSFKSKYQYTYAGMKDGLSVVDFTIKTTYQKPTAQPDLFSVVKGELTDEEGRGVYHFDAEKGRLIRAEKSLRARGRLTIEAGDVKTDLEFVSVQQLRVRSVAEKK